MFEEQILQPRVIATFAQLTGRAKYLAHRPAHRKHLLPRDKSVQPDRNMRLGGKPSADANGKTSFTTTGPFANCGRERQIVDLRIGTPVAASADTDLVFARQSVKIRIAGQVLRHGKYQRRGVADLVLRHAGKRAAGDGPRDIATGAERGKPVGEELLQNFRQIFNGDPVQLNILADGYVGRASRISFRQRRNQAKLVCAQETVRDANSHHEVRRGLAFTSAPASDSGSVTLGINAPPLEIGLQPGFRNGAMALAREAADLFQTLPWVLLLLQPFGLLRLGLFDLGLYRSCIHSCVRSKSKKPTAVSGDGPFLKSFL